MSAPARQHADGRSIIVGGGDAEAERERVRQSNPRGFTWHAGRGVDVSQAEADFVGLQRKLSRQVSRASDAHNEHQQEAAAGEIEEGRGHGHDVAGPPKGAEDVQAQQFDLETALREGLAAERAAGIRPKHIGVCWERLTVKGWGGSTNYVKTFPDAFVDFVDVVTPVMNLLGLRRKGPGGSRGGREVTLLDGFRGMCRPGDMVLVLGKPGSGCTTFLRNIANQRYGYTSVSGDVRYGPFSAREFERYRGEAVYNMEDDVHHATLTVEQTLGFALDTKIPGKLPAGVTKEGFKQDVISTLLKMFNIEHTRKTMVGGHFVRGVSGGERKRVSIAEMMITNACVLSWDNSTRGLDSSTALDFVRSLRIMTDLYRTSTFVSLYQASENIYRLFDRVLVIDSGRQVYFGPAAEARAYFEGLGFLPRPRQTTPDYLTACTDEFEREYAPGRSRDDAPHSPETLAAAFDASPLARRLDDEMAHYKKTLLLDDDRSGGRPQHQIRDDFRTAVREQKRGMVAPWSVYSVGFHRQVLALVKRQFALKLQDRLGLALSWLRSIIVAIVVGTLFWRLPTTSAAAFARGGVVFLSCLFNAFQAFSELPDTLLGRDIVNKHKAYAFHRPSALWIANIIVDQAFGATQVLVYSAIVYFMCGLASDAGAFFTFYLFILAGTVSMSLFFRIIGCASPDFNYAIRILVVMVTLFVLTVGYLIQYQSEHAWLRWIYWVNTLGLSFAAIMENEFVRLRLTCSAESLIPSGPGYDDINHQVCTLPGSVAGSDQVDGAVYIAQGFSYYRGDLWRNLAIIVAIIVFFLIMNIVLGELVRYGAAGSTARVYQKPNAERNALNAELARRRDARRRGGTASRPVVHLDDRKKDTVTLVPADARVEENDTVPSQPAAPSSDSSAEESSPAESLRLRSESILTWEAVNYDVPVGSGGTLRLLRDVYGYVQPGKLTALMGASGAGKTTLLDVLAARKNIGVVSGSILVDGSPPGRQFQRSTSYAEQLDLHDPEQTVREALRFSADLRQPFTTPRAEKCAYVEEILALLEMEAIADCIIGSPEAGLTVEQRKRVTIGVELAARPELLLFLDEPTSGLDSQSAFHIVRFLRKLADAGQAILCTIHQPNAVLFEQFDRLLLLQRGGRCVYFGDIGPDASVVRDFFRRHGATAAPSDNVAEFMLEAIGAGSSPRIGDRDWADIWADSDELAQVKADIAAMRERRRAAVSEGLERQRSLATARADKEGPNTAAAAEMEYASPWTHQLRVVVRRASVSYWRSPAYLFTRLFNHVAIALLTGLTYLQLDQSRSSLQYKVFIMFQITVLPALILTQVEIMYHLRRSIFFREASSKMYNPLVFAASMVLAETPYCILCAIAFFLPLYYMPGFQTEALRAGYQFLMVLATEFFTVTIGHVIASLTPSSFVSGQLDPFITIVFPLFCGVAIPGPQMPAFWRTWLFQIDPFTRLIGGTVSTALDSLPVICAPSELNSFVPPADQTCGEYMSAFFARGGPGYVVDPNATDVCDYCAFSVGNQFFEPLGFRFANRWRDFGILTAFIGSNLVILFLAVSRPPVLCRPIFSGSRELLTPRRVTS